MSSNIRLKEINKVTLQCMAGNIALTILKMFAGIAGGSAAMVADAMHSFSDFITDIVLMAGVHLGNRPADAEYPYGHGRLETFATLFIALILLVAAVGIFWNGAQSVYKVIQGEILPKPGYIALAMAAISILVKEAMYQYTVRVGRRIDSMAVISNAWHHRGDALSSMATLVGIGGAILLGHKWTVLDPVTAMLVSFFIFSIGFKIAKVAVQEMLDASLPLESIEKIKEICLSVDGAKRPHNLKTRKIGYRVSIEMHMNFDKETSFVIVHDKMCLIEDKLRKQFGKQTFISIHPEPK